MSDEMTMLFGDFLSFICDSIILLLAFYRMEAEPVKTWRRIVAALLLLSLLPIYICPFPVPDTDSWLSILVVVLLLSMLRLAVAFCMLLVGKAVPAGWSFYYSCIYVVIYNAYRLIAGPAGLGSVLRQALPCVPGSVREQLLHAAFKYSIAWLLIVSVRKAIFFRVRETTPAYRNPAILIILCAAVSVRASLAYIIGEITDGPIVSLALAFIPVLLLLIVLFMERMISTGEELRDEQMQHMMTAHRLQSIELQQSRDESMRILLHDIQNHLLAIGQMAGDGSERVRRYVRELIKEYGPVQTVVDTGNEMVNGLISVKMEEVARQGVSFSVVMDARALTGFSDPDVSVIFGNALDNAIEGCLSVEKPDERFVDIRGGLVAGQMVITITNSFHGHIRMHNGLPISTKVAGRHGLGLKSLRRAVDKYKGTVDITVEEQSFSLTIMLPVFAGGESG